MPSSTSVFAKTVAVNWRLIAASCGVFALVGLAVFALTPRWQVAQSVVQVSVQPFDFKTIASGNDIAQRVAAKLNIPAAAAPGGIDVEPVTAPYAYTPGYPTILQIDARAHSAQDALAINTAVLNESYAVYSHIDQSGAMAIIDKPYIVHVTYFKEVLRDLFAGIVVGAVLAYVLVWLRGRAAEE